MERAHKSIVWFRRDLRIEDNPALSLAAREGRVLPVFVWCPKEEGQFYPGRASRWWLKQSLKQLDSSLRSLGSPMLFIKTECTLSALVDCVRAIGATKVIFNHLYDPVSLVRDHKIKAELTEMGISVQTFNGDLLYEPWEVHDENGHAYTVFNSFWQKCMGMSVELKSSLPPWQLVPPAGTEGVKSCSIEELGLENEMEKSSNALLSRAWSPGWSNAEKVLSEFIGSHLLHYSNDRMDLGGTTTSLLSPYLHFGEVSIRKIYQNVRVKQIQWANEENLDAGESANLFLRSIGLREYSRYLCFNFPFTHERALLGNLIHYPWRTDEVHFKCWRQGKTGYPLVDAGMRELWATGWVHNRTRVITSSFFVKYLLLPWTWGVKYFWDTLLDADLESDILGWQYITGGLPDGHELDRFDRPEAQGLEFDPNGEYVRQWLPELARMPTEWIHHPWDAPISVLRAAGVELGINYPKPIIEITVAKERMKNAVAIMWKLDRAARFTIGSSLEEDVSDNLNDINELDIPKVPVRKNITCTTLSQDQKVPSLLPFDDSLYGPSKGKGLHTGGTNHKNFQYKLSKDKTSDMEGAMHSTADSSSARKRSLVESLDIVPGSSFMSSQGKPPTPRTPRSHGEPSSTKLPAGSSRHQINTNIYNTPGPKEEETDAESFIEDRRPCKRPF